MSNEAPTRIWAFAPDIAPHFDLRGALLRHRAGAIGIFDGMSVWQDAPSPAGDTVEYVRSDLLTAAEARAQAAEAERDRLRMILEARDAFDAGEPSKPPHTGKDRTTLAEITGENDE